MREIFKRVVTLVTMLCIAACFTLAPTTASAAPAWKQRREANKLLREAKRHEQKNENLKAAKKLKRADKLMPKPSIKLRIARLLVEMGDMVQAMDILREAMESKPRGWAEKQAVKKSIALLSETEDRAPTIEINAFKPDSNAMTITIDGEDYESSDGPVPRNPGSYTIKATATGFKDWTKTVTVAQGGRATFDITMESLIDDEDDAGSSGFPHRTLSYVTFGFGGVNLALGIGFGIAAISTTNAVLREWPCPDSVCPREAEADILAAKTNGNLSTIGMVTGVAGILGGTALLIVANTRGNGDAKDGADEADEAAAGRMKLTAKPIVGPGFVGVHGTF
jgi:hypothetical protein